MTESTKCSQRCRSPPPRTQRSSIYRHLKRRLGRSLKSRFYQRTVVRSRKIIAHKCFRTKGSVLGPKTLQASMPKSNSPGCHGQLNGSSLHQQTGRDSLTRDMRPSMENHELVSSIQNISTCQTHSRVPKCDRGLPVQINSNSVNGVVTTPSGVQKNLHKVVHTSGGSLCHSAKPQVATIRLSSSRSKRMEHRCSKHKLVKPCSLCLPSNSSTSKSNTKCPPVQLPPNPDSPGLAGHALVLGSGPSISGNSTSVVCISKSTQAVKQPGVSPQSAIPQPPCLVSRSEQLQEQGFSSEVAERIAAPQRSSTRSIYQAKWALFEKWCRENSVDVSKPSIKQASDFFMHLFQDLNRRPSTIDGYRTAILDYLGPTGLHIAQSTDLNRLLASFHRDRRKATRNILKRNLSIVLNELTKKPFEPMKDSDIKHLTLKTAFLLALASGKRRSEIHAWVANKVSNLGQWEKVALFASSDFIAKNQLAREGAQSVSPVVIPALTTIVDRQFKQDRSLCPLCALRYYLDRTKDLRGDRSLLFISFKKGHSTDIRPSTLSSWLKQTILLCYKQADQQALDLVQVEAYDIRAFAASIAFYGGEYIL